MRPPQLSFTGTPRFGAAALITIAILSSRVALVAQGIAPHNAGLPTDTVASSFGPDGPDKTPAETGDAASAIVTALPDAPGAIATPPDNKAAAEMESDPNPPGPDLAGPDSRTRLHADPPPRIAPVHNRYIEPFETAQHLTKTQNLIFGFRQSVSPYFLLTILAAAGYEQARNSAPNYGTNIGSYGERLGAAAIRDTSQSVFADSLMAPLLHQDPRYYIMGNRHSVFARGAYAATRVLVTKSSDDGRLMPNYSEVAGYAEAAALTNAYYPDVNVGFGQTARSVGGSLIGLAFSNVVREFLPDLLRVAHLERFE